MNEPSQNSQSPFAQTFLHGTKADLKIGDLIGTGFTSNYIEDRKANNVYISATLDAAIWGAELALGEGPERIYLVEATGTLEDDPNLTDKKFPGNPTLSYRSKQPVKVVGEITVWQSHSPEIVKTRKNRLAELKEQGLDTIDD